VEYLLIYFILFVIFVCSLVMFVGYSGADLKNLCTEAAFGPIRG
jgi:hypothetical protein